MGPSSPRVRRRLISRAVAALLVLCVIRTGSPPPAVSADEPIDPGRPDLITGTGIVAPGRVQVESGAAYERTGRTSERRLAAEVDLLIGVTEDLEARVQLEPLVILRGDDRARGVGDVALGLKWRIFHAGRTTPGHARTPVLTIVERRGVSVDEPDGAIDARGAVVGTYVHGLRAGRPADPTWGSSLSPASRYDQLADAIAASLDMKAIARLARAPL